MTKTRRLFAVLMFPLSVCIVTSADAASTSYVSRAGTATTGCSKTAPCGIIANAIQAAGVGGEAICLDKGTFGGAIISQSVTISCGDDLWEAPATEVNINAPAGSNVSIEGLTMDGTNFAGTAMTISGQGSLRLHHVRIGNTPGAGTDGLLFKPRGGATLTISDSIFYSNGGPGTGGGIVINPQSGGFAQVALERVVVTGNAFGIAADGSGSTGGINMTIADSMIAGNTQDGIIATTSSGGAAIGVYVKNTKSVNNAFGIRSLGPNVTVRVDGSSVIGNGTGLSFSGGGILATYGNNAVNANAANGSFSGSIPLQ